MPLQQVQSMSAELCNVVQKEHVMVRSIKNKDIKNMRVLPMHTHREGHPQPCHYAHPHPGNTRTPCSVWSVIKSVWFLKCEVKDL